MHKKRNYWEFISKVWGFLKESDRIRWELLWDSINAIVYSMSSKVEYLIRSSNPETSDTDTVEYYYDINVGTEHAIPLKIDPTDSNSVYEIKPIRVIIEPPIVEDDKVFRRDSLVISDYDYYNINKVITGMSAVITGIDGIVTGRVYSVQDDNGEKTITISGGLIGYENNPVTMYFTDSKSYNIDDFILDIDSLYRDIDGNPEFIKNDSYIIENNVITFNMPIYESDILYCKNAKTVNTSMYSSYSGMLGISGYKQFSHDNSNGRTLISGLMKSLQMSDIKEEYNKALNLYYGMPAGIYDSTVNGVYESYGYRITSINGNIVSVDVSSDISGLIADNGTMVSNDNVEYKIVAIDRVAGTIELDNIVGLSVESTISVKLVNKSSVNNVGVNTIVISDDISSELTHVIDVYKKFWNYTENSIEYYTKYPEFNLYNNDDIIGVYHMTKAESDPSGGTKITIYDGETEKLHDGTILYNDYIENVGDVNSGEFHMQWPTHKRMIATDVYGDSYDYYMDSGIDSKFDTGDTFKKYDVIPRNVSVLDMGSLDMWNKYGNMNMYSDIDSRSSILEATGLIDGAFNGYYLPTGIKPRSNTSFNIYPSEVFSITQNKFIKDGSSIKSINNEFVLTTTIPNVDSFIKQSNIVIDLIDGFSNFEPLTDKVYSVFCEFEAYHDLTSNTIILAKNGDWHDNVIGNISESGAYILHYDSTKSILTVLKNTASSTGLSGVKNVVSNIRYSGNRMMSR